MIDRISLHYVVDFFDFRLINFPIFNVADIYVTVSMIVLILLCAFYYHDHEIDVLFSKSKKTKILQYGNLRIYNRRSFHRHRRATGQISD